MFGSAGRGSAPNPAGGFAPEPLPAFYKKAGGKFFKAMPVPGLLFEFTPGRIRISVPQAVKYEKHYFPEAVGFSWNFKKRYIDN